MTGVLVGKQKLRSLIYQEVKLKCRYQMDLMRKKKVIVEILSVIALIDSHLAHVHNRRKFLGCKPGPIINFNVPYIKEGGNRLATIL